MKIYFAILFFLLNTSSVIAQTFIPLENSSYRDNIEDIKELDNGNFIYVQTYQEENDFEKLQELLIATDSIFTTVKLVDEDFQPIAEFPIKTNEIFETLTGVDIFLTENGFLISGYAFAPSNFSSFRKAFLIELDHDLNETSRTIFAHANNIFWITNPIINHDGNIVYIGKYNQILGPLSFLAEYSLDGELLNMIDFTTSYADNFVQLADGSYNVYNLFNRLWHLPADWSELSEGIRYEFGDGFYSNDTPILLEDETWLHSGRDHFIDPATQDRYYVSQAVIIRPDSTTEIIYQNRPAEDVSIAPAINGMDMIDTNYIYFTSVYAGCSALFHPDNDCLNYVSIHSIQLNGTENWTQYLGFDAAYHSIKVLATQDSGVVLLVYRYSELDNLEDEGDMYFVKLDKDGNVDFPVNTEEETPPFIVQQFLVYPNPARDLLRYTFSHSNIQSPIVKIFDSAGKLLVTDEISDKETNISALVPGYYFYEILDQDKRVQTGKLVKE